MNRKRKSIENEFFVTEADYIFHDIMHNNISIQKGFQKCSNEKELNKLYKLLEEYGEIFY